ncbi:major facilitator superfamily domain-containing protein 8-like isoform X2 [Acropora muricata]|uniref:major facilitator superfamily domain-containing protein 8-like isoform X2 n=1 Tax=Acropora muricata TaxID=159855 RepID=UPI0034E40755
MKATTKKRCTRICVGLFFLLGGIEYAVILPTLWLYLEHRFDAEQWFFGVVFASFCFSNLLSSPFFGFWVDYTQKTKPAILFANLFEIGGNFLYFVAWSKYLVLGARLISGPGLNLFLRKFNIQLGPFKIDTYTAPGIFMTVMWLLLEIIMLLFYFDLPKVHSIESEDFSEYSINSQTESSLGTQNQPKHFQNHGSINGYVPNKIVHSHTINGDLSNTNSDLENEKLLNTVTGGLHEPLKKASVVDKWHLAKDLVREEIIVILASQFMMFFNETAFETLVTPLSEYLLGWKEIQNSILYCLVALEAILVFILVKKLSSKISDRWLMVIGVSFEGFALVWYLLMLANAKPHSPLVLPTLIVGTFVIVFGIPFFSVANVSLYSKITDERTQGIAQGIQRSVTGVAMIMGPLWGGALLHQLYLMLGVMAALEVILGGLMFLSFHRLKEPNKQLPVPYDEIISDNERTPLIT